MEELTSYLTQAFGAEFIDIYEVQCNLCVLDVVKEHDVEVLRFSWILFFLIIFKCLLKTIRSLRSEVLYPTL